MKASEVNVTLPTDGKLLAHGCAAHCIGDETPSRNSGVPTLRMLAFTWNVGGTAPTNDALAQLAILAERKHIVVVGLQKVPETVLQHLLKTLGCHKNHEHPEAIHHEMSHSHSNFTEATTGKFSNAATTIPAKPPVTEWGRALVDCFAGLGLEPLQPVESFAKRLAVFVKVELLEAIQSLAVGHVAAGAGTFHSKGGIGLRFELFGLGFCFVNVWLRRGMQNKKKREKDFHQITEKLGMRGTTPDNDKLQTWSIPGHDVLIWLGCQNTCFNASPQKRVKDILGHIRRFDKEVLLGLDQLVEASQAGHAFQRIGKDLLQEGPLNFAPTATYIKNKDEINEGSYFLQHIPGTVDVELGWCDRVLFHFSNKAAGLTLLQYNSIPTLLQAPNRPVFADFALPVTTDKVTDDLRKSAFGMPSIAEG